MGNEPETKPRTLKRGTSAKQLGALCMAIGVIVAVVSGAFTPLAAIFFFGGLVALIVGVAQRDNART